MATHNFAYENRLIYVEDEDYESGNVPEHKEYVRDATAIIRAIIWMNTVLPFIRLI